MAARGPGLRHPAPEALRRDRADGGHAAPPSATSTWPGCSWPCASAWPPRGSSAEVTGRPEAPLEHLREDGRAGQGVRRDPRPGRPSGVIVESEKDCWAALGSIHAIWSPVQGRFKDYINSPKFNLYQSLHTTVIGLEGKPIEVQIRTQEMHRRAEYGIAAHWGYKEQGKGAAATTAEMAWLQRIVDWQQETIDPFEFLETLKLDLEQDEVYVFTPKGKVIALRGGVDPDRLRLRHPHRGRPPLHRRQGERPARARSTPSSSRPTPSRSSPPRSPRPGRRGTGCRSSPRRGPATRSASGSAGSGARTPSRPGARS